MHQVFIWSDRIQERDDSKRKCIAEDPLAFINERCDHSVGGYVQPDMTPCSNSEWSKRVTIMSLENAKVTKGLAGPERNR